MASQVRVSRDWLRAATWVAALLLCAAVYGSAIGLALHALGRVP